MSNNISNHNSHKEHGTVASYVIGFVLSLVFSLIPYFLVVNKSLNGSTLIATILGFGVIQMLIQIFFFLHLGRGPKPLYNVVFFVATVSLILVVVVGSIFIMNHLHYNMSPSEITKKLAQKEGISQINGEKTGACQHLGKNHKVYISVGKISPAYTVAKLCDTLTMVNNDENDRQMTFATHPNHGSYAGETDFSLRKGRGKTFTLNQLGTYIFHDHLEPSTSGTFTVNE